MSLFDFIENKQYAPSPGESTHRNTAVKTGCYTKNKKPEKLKFLKPCPLCEGRDFICTQKGGFYCARCKPGVTGSPVIAKGSWDLPEIANSPDLELESNQKDSKEKSTQRAAHIHSFRTAFPWIMAHLVELQKSGWTRPALFRRGKYSWPMGNWGVAWMDVWSKNNLKIQIQSNGTLAFMFSSSGRQITQTANPQQYRQR